MSTSAEAPQPTARFGLHPGRGLLLGLSAIRLSACGLAVALLVFGLVAAGAVGLAVTAPLWVGLSAGAFVNWHGQPAIEWAPSVIHWAARSTAGQDRYRKRLLEPRPAGTMALPGDATSLRFYNDPESGACMIHDPHRRTLSAVIRVTHPAYVLLSPDQQLARVTSWGRLLAGLAPAETCAGIQVLEATVADSGEQTSTWYEDHRRGPAGWADEQYRQLLNGARIGATTHRSSITLSLDLRRAARSVREAGRGLVGAAQVLRGDMAVLEQSLREAELRMEGWLDEEELAGVVQDAYDPGAAARSDRTSVASGLDRAGPTAIDEHWDCLRHDSGWSCVLWVAEWPRVEVPAHFLHGLVFVPGVRRSISLIARPLGVGQALRDIRRAKTEMLTDSSTKARIGQIADLSDAQKLADVNAREQAVVSGHADMVFAGFITVTAPSHSLLVKAVAEIERAAVAAGCETRIVYGAQAQAFVTAALPLGRMAI